MKRLLLSVLLLFSALRVSAQAPGFIETLTLTSFANSSPYALLITPDSGYVIVQQLHGPTYGYSSLTKLDRNGNVLWSQRYGNTSYGIYLRDVAPANDDGFILIGAFDSLALENRLIMIRVDSTGQMLWSKKYDDAAYMQWDANVIRRTSDGGYIMTGAKIGNIYSMAAVKTDSAGNIEWARNYCIGNNKDRSYDIRELPDSGFVLCGKSTEYNPQMTAEGIYVLRVDKNGNPIWGKGFGSLTGYPLALRITPDCGIAVAGFHMGNGFGNSDVALLKLDTSGNLQWMHLYGTPASNMAQSLDILPDGRFVVTGCFTNALSQQQGMLMFTDSAGNLLNTFEYPVANLMSADRVLVTPDSGIAIVGISPAPPGNYRTTLMKTDFSGSLYCGASPLVFGDMLFTPTITSGFTVDSSGTMFPGIEKYDTPVSMNVNIACAANSNFYCSNASACENATIQFINISDTTSSAYWYVNGVLTDSTFNFTHAFGTSGVHTVMMISQPSGDTSQMQVNIMPAPVITFTLPDTICNDLSYFNIWQHFSPTFGMFTTVFGTTDTAAFYPNQMQTGYSPITYTYTDGNGCTATVSTAIYIDACITADAIGEINEPAPVIFYNMESGQLDLSFTCNATRILEVYDVVGQRVCSTKTPDARVRVSLPDLAAGMYVLTVMSGNQQYAYRFVVQSR